MTRTTRLVGAAGAALAVLSASTIASASPTTTVAAPAPPSAFPPPSGDVPADWPILVDDTRTITIAVPSTWTDVDTVPAQNPDGTPRVWISATPDASVFFPADDAADTFAAPGVIYTGAPYYPDTASILAASEYHSQCTAEPLQTFDDGTFAGHIQTFAACGATATRIVMLAAHPSDRSFTAVVFVQLVGQPDDATTLNGLLLSIGRVVPG